MTQQTMDPHPPELVLNATALALRAVPEWLSGNLAGVGSERAGTLMGKLELSVHEVCMNIVDHSGLAASDSIRLEFVMSPHEVEIRVIDKGRPYLLPQGLELPDEPQIRGYGLVIADKLVDSLRCRRVGDENHWSLGVMLHSNQGESQK